MTMKNEQSVFTPSGVSYFWAKVSIYGPALMARAFFDGGAESNAVIYSAYAHGMAPMDSEPKILIKNTAFSHCLNDNPEELSGTAPKKTPCVSAVPF